jgi:hypothetical protein
VEIEVKRKIVHCFQILLPSHSQINYKNHNISPDISAPITGPFHIEGPFLLENNDYIIKVEVISIDGKILSEPREDVFILPSKI